MCHCGLFKQVIKLTSFKAGPVRAPYVDDSLAVAQDLLLCLAFFSYRPNDPGYIDIGKNVEDALA